MVNMLMIRAKWDSTVVRVMPGVVFEIQMIRQHAFVLKVPSVGGSEGTDFRTKMKERAENRKFLDFVAHVSLHVLVIRATPLAYFYPAFALFQSERENVRWVIDSGIFSCRSRQL